MAASQASPDETTGRIYRAVVEAAPMALVVARGDGTIVRVNQEAERLFGYGPDELIGHRIEDLVPEPLRGSHEVYRAGYVASPRPRPMGEIPSIRGLRKDGAEFPADVLLTPIRIDGELLVGAWIRDDTERRRLHGLLAGSERMALLGTIAASVAHEIRNPLSTILINLGGTNGMTDQLRARFGDDPMFNELDQMHTDVVEAATRIKQIAADVKLFSQNQEPSPRGNADLVNVLNSAVRMVKAEVRNRARIVCDYADLPAVVGSESRLGQVFLNLLVNAAQAVPEGSSSENEIRVTARTDPGGHVIVEVSDTGIGIAPEVEARVFDAFFTTKPAGMGSGLGLAISHQIVTEAGGRIEFESVLGKGTTFRVTLPVGTMSPSKRPPRGPSLVPPERRGRVLLIDDDASVLKTVERFLSEEHDVVALSDARDALGRIRVGERFDAIILDAVMPDMGGREFHEELLKLDPDQASRIILLTGATLTDGDVEFFDRAENPCVEKPFDNEALKALVESFRR